MKRFSLFFAFLVLPLSVSAASFQAGETVEVETAENAYAAGSVVQVNNEVRGDVYLAGEDIQVNARVREDAKLAGDSVTINGQIGDDLHAFGSTVILNETVRGDAMLFGQKIVVGPDVRVYGSTIVAGQMVTAQGRYDKDTRLMGGSVVMDGLFMNDVRVNAGESFEISEDSDIRGDLHVSVPQGMGLVIPEGVVRGEVHKKFLEGRDLTESSFFGQFRFFSFLSRVLIGAILIMIARMFAVQFGGDIRANFWKVLGIGFLGLVVPPIAAFFLFLPMITIPLALIVLVLWGTLLYFGSLMTGLLVANLFFPLQKEENTWHLIGKFALGTFIMTLIKMVPFLGFPVAFALFLVSIGSIVQYEMTAGSTLRKAKLL